MNTEITDIVEIRRPKPQARNVAEARNSNKGANCGLVFYDAGCPFCTQWARRLERLLKTRGFGIAALQSRGAAEDLGVDPENLLAEMRVLTTNGRVLGGADGVVELSRHYWWAWPVVWFSKLPGTMDLLRLVYRRMAQHRRRTADGFCKAPGTNIQASGKLQASSPNLTVLTGGGNWSDWIPLMLLPIGAVLLRNILPAWVFMWALAFAMYVGCKWLTWRRARGDGCRATIARSLGYFFAWPGMDAKRFLAESKSTGPWSLKFPWGLELGAWSFALVKTFAGAAFIWVAARQISHLDALAAGWLAMIGIVLFLHFGVFDLLALAWRSAGVNVLRVMRAPLLATSLADFWSRRWNTAFHTLADELMFRPAVRRLGTVRTTVAVFLISGLVHEAVISFPARGGYGLPAAYFLLQAFGVLAERSAVGCRLKLGKGARGWLYVMIFTAGPVFWLFHPAFIKNVILPMLRAFGSS